MMADNPHVFDADAARRIVAATRYVESLDRGKYPPRRAGAADAPLQRIRLVDPLYKGASASGFLLLWDEGTLTFSASATSVQVYGDLMTGYAFPGQDLYAMSIGHQWQSVSSGSFTCRGTLNSSLSSGGTAGVDVTRYNGSAWVSISSNVSALEHLGLTTALSSGTVVVLSWCDLSLLWLVTGAAC